MINGFLVFILAVAYIGVLFTLAYAGDQQPSLYTRARHRAAIYSLCLAVYCTSWTFYGAVGTASTSGLAFLPIYLGPALVFVFATPLIRKLITLSKRHNSTSIADFIATRYGKSQSLAAFVSLIALIGILPYIALQLKAVSMGFGLLTGAFTPPTSQLPLLQDTALYVALAMAAFTILFGTRHLTSSEHHHGLMLAIAFESVVKLVAFIAVGVFALSLLTTATTAPSPQVPSAAAWQEPTASMILATAGLAVPEGAWQALLARSPDPLAFCVYTLLAGLAIICLPRQFHVMAVENHDVGDVGTARWAFPLYLLVLSLLVLPVTVVGLALFPSGDVHPDTFILALPLAQEQRVLALLAFIGGASAATGMVIMSSVTLSTMISNELLVPLLLRTGRLTRESNAPVQRQLLQLRRYTIAAIIVSAYLFSRHTSQSVSLAAIGLLSFAAIAQFGPALLGALYWRRGTRGGAFAGLAGGIGLWAITLLLPAIIGPDQTTAPLAGVATFGRWLPDILFGFATNDGFVQGALLSLTVNALIYIAVSLYHGQSLDERFQVAGFLETAEPSGGVVAWSGSVTLDDLRTVSERFLGKDQSNALLASGTDVLAADRPVPRLASPALVQRVENLLAGLLGASSARLVLTSALRGGRIGIEDVASLVDEASQVMRFNRELLQSAIENMGLGVSVIDRHLNLVAWNSRYLELFDYPRGFVRVGRPIADMLRHNLVKAGLGPEEVEATVRARLQSMREGRAHEYERLKPDGSVILIQGSPMPDGGFVTSFSDITAKRRAEQALKDTNLYLEQRVRERTEELSTLNAELSQARQEADKANQGKTRFLASASHDLLQPLHAARLFTSALQNLLERRGAGDEEAGLARHLDNSLASAEEILNALLDISKLDAGAIPPQPRTFRVDDLFAALGPEFAVIATARGLRFTWVPCSLTVHSDAQMLRRILQNFLSNAIRHTRQGRVLLGARRRGRLVRLEVWDTGPGIPESMRECIFEEFRRLGDGGQDNRGLGLGLAIVDRIARLLDTPVRVRSWPGRGSVFSVDVPLSQSGTGAGDAAQSSAKDTLASTDPAFAGLPVLCIDNEPAILEAMRAVLSGWGCEVLVATGRQEALDSLAIRTPQVILADYQLEHDDNGLQVLEELGARIAAMTTDASRPPAIMPVVITASNSAELRATVRERGFHFLRKPLKPAALRALLSTVSPAARP